MTERVKLLSLLPLWRHYEDYYFHGLDMLTEVRSSMKMRKGICSLL